MSRFYRSSLREANLTKQTSSPLSFSFASFCFKSLGSEALSELVAGHSQLNRRARCRIGERKSPSSRSHRILRRYVYFLRRCRFLRFHRSSLELSLSIQAGYPLFRAMDRWCDHRRSHFGLGLYPVSSFVARDRAKIRGPQRQNRDAVPLQIYAESALRSDGIRRALALRFSLGISESCC